MCRADIKNLKGKGIRGVQKKHCPNCKSEDLALLNKAYSLCRCNDCGLIFKYMRDINRSTIKKIQNDVYTKDLIALRASIKMVEIMARYRLIILQKYKREGNLLEIGCATGEFLQFAKDAGFNVIGVDASKRLCDSALEKGLNIKCGRIEDFLFPANYFDVIALFHLIEHIENPKSFLLHLANLLDRDGFLFIIAPNVKSSTNKIFGWKHPDFTQSDHLYFYSKETLTNLLFDTGYQVVDMLSKEYRHHFFTSLLGFLSKRDFFLKLKPQIQHDNVNTNKTHLTGVKPLFKHVGAQSPYIMGTILYPILKPYGLIVEKNIRGHELIVIAKKRTRDWGGTKIEGTPAPQS